MDGNEAGFGATAEVVPVVTAPAHFRPPVDFARRPMLVFWETTRACQLACKHCRASATPQAPPGELTRDEGVDLINQVAGFGRPYPILVLTGGDCLLRQDLFDLVGHATSLGIPTCLAPSVTPALTADVIERIAESGIRAVSISLDGATPATHEEIRGIPGHFAETIAAIRALVAAGVIVQINTAVLAVNVDELPDIAALVEETGAHIWEVFFLVHTGRGVDTGALTPAEHEAVCHFLFDASHYGFIVRTVEAPFFRRVVAERRAGRRPPEHGRYPALVERLRAVLGDPKQLPSAHTAATRDGKGILFVAHDGEVYPAGFLPLGLGNVREQPLSALYRDDPNLRAIRRAGFSGRCGHCEYADLCGGSRARAYAATGDLLGEDPACPYQPTTA